MKPRLKKAFKISGIVLGAVVVLLLAGVLLLVFDKPLVRTIILKQLNKGAGTTARLERIDYSIFPFRVTAQGLDLGQEDAFQKLGVSLSRFEARGSFWRLLRGEKPAFDVLEADGLRLRLEQKAVSEVPLDLEKTLLQVSDAFAWAKRIALKNGSLAAALLNGRAEIENLDLTLTPGPAKDVVGYEIGRGDLVLEDKSGSPLLAAGLRSSGELGLSSPFVVTSSLSLDKARFALAGLEDSLDSLTVSVAGRFDKSGQELTVSRFEVKAPGLLAIEGKAAGKLGHGLFIEAEASATLEDLAAAAALVRPKLPPSLRDSPWRGRADLSGRYMIQRSDQGTKDSLNASLSLEGLELAPVVSGRPLPIRAAGQVSIAGPTSDPRLSADVRSTLGRLAASGASVEAVDLHFVGSGSRSAADVSLLEARLARLDYEASAGARIAFDQGAFTAKGSFDLVRRQGVLASLEARLSGLACDLSAGRRIAFEAADLAASGRFDLARKEGVLTSLEAKLPGFTPLRLSGRAGLAPGAPVEIKFDANGVDLPALRALAKPFIPADFAAWDLGGTLGLALAASRPAGDPAGWRFSGTAALAGAKFNDPSFTVAGDGLDPVIRLEGQGSASQGLSWSGSLDVSQGESLWKSVYIAWSKHPLKLTAAGRYDPRTGGIEGLVARVALPEVGSIEARGTAQLAPSTAFDLAAEAGFSLGPLYSLYSQSGVAESARTKLEGSLAASLAVRKTAESLSVGGRLKLDGVNVESPGTKTLLLGISADLPLLYDSKPMPAAGAGAPPDPEEGRIHIGELQSPMLTLKPVDIVVRAAVNEMAVEPLSLPLFGGQLELGQTTFRLDPAAGSFHGLGSLRLSDVDISRFPIASPQFKLTGKIQADFPRLDIAPDKIAIAGRGEASVFGGTIVLRDLAVANPFAAGRSISLDIDLVDLDMKKLTDEVPFGEVTGIVRGEVRGLVITYGQPESFEFRIESVPRKGVPQTFSLKAVDNLTVLSSGQKASGGTSSFWMRFVRGFRYQKLGIVSTLHNDMFTLNGTIHEGGVEYLMKKPALFGISVVNREPNKKISFKEMVGRLKRIG